jgi:predicted deacetylase
MSVTQLVPVGVPVSHDSYSPRNHSMFAKFLLRFDDICPTLDWKRWDRIESILIEECVRPIMAVIPDNQDPGLHEGEPNNRFWDRVRTWQDRGWTIGLHGYQHCYVNSNRGILGLNSFSEFAGVPLNEQIEKLRKALAIFHREGVRPDIWVAPGHSFDANTISALLSFGITTVSDGLSLFPYRDSLGVFWVPQQLWKFRAMPFGVWTLCIHHQHAPYTDLTQFRLNLRQYRNTLTDLPEVLGIYSLRRKTSLDALFGGAWRLALRNRNRALARSVRQRMITASMLKSRSISSRELAGTVEPRVFP